MEEDGTTSEQNPDALVAVIEHGRVCYDDELKICLPLFAAMPTPREIESRTSYQTCNNMPERIDYNKNYVPMNEQCIDKFATTQQMVQLMLVAENNIAYDKVNKHQWNDDGKDRKLTLALARIKSGEWNQEGLDQYHELLEKRKARKERVERKYKDNPQDWPDYFDFPSLWGKVKGSKKGDKTDEIPDAKEVLVGFIEDDLNPLGEGIESYGEKEEKQPVEAV
eukprot:1852572-Ditylum_brightwellii.AAC.1